jgi:bifunctional DNase/RNase
MVPVFPYHIRRSDSGDFGELLLSLEDRKSAMVLQLTLEQARILAVEMRGLATDHCTLHHLAMAITRTVGASISRVIIKGVDVGQVTGVIRLEHGQKLYDVAVDVAATLAMAMHLGLPIYMESMHLLREDRLEPVEQKVDEAPSGAQMPQVFRDVIEAMEMSEEDGENPEGCEHDP